MRAPNTLYAGRTQSGKRNHIMVLAYRIYLPDRSTGRREGVASGLFGGVPAPRFTLYGRDGTPRCPSALKNKLRRIYAMGSTLSANFDKLANPAGYLGEPENPTVWINEYSREKRRDNVYVGNEDTIYITTRVSSRFGDMLVLRWRAARTPEASFSGAPISADVDMRYWSLSFAYIDMKNATKVLTSRTVADVDAPVLADGTRQLVVGFGGMARPASVPAEQWVGLAMTEGYIIMRNIMIEPGYAGDPGRLAAGRITGEWDRCTPGGVYCGAAEFAKNPDIGLERQGPSPE